MKTSYRGFEIDVKREKSLGGWSMLYTTIFRESKGVEMKSLAEDSGEAVRDQIGYTKSRIEAELGDGNWSAEAGAPCGVDDDSWEEEEETDD
jgi:hypothetical protein